MRLSVLDAFSGIPVYGVCGNTDDWEVSQTLPSSRVLNCNGFCIGVTHGWGGDDIRETVMETFADTAVDAIVFGHTHRPLNVRLGRVLLFNPGSYDGNRSQEGGRTVGILTCLQGRPITGRIVPVISD